jgi:hypothetical protein
MDNFVQKLFSLSGFSRNTARALSTKEKAILSSTARSPIEKPNGNAVEVEVGVYSYFGDVTFKIPYRVMTGTARQASRELFTWQCRRLPDPAYP